MDVHAACSLQDHSWVGFAPGVIGEPQGPTPLCMICAGQNGIEVRVSGPKLSCQCRLDGMEVIPPVIPPANAGLVCNHHNPNPQRITTGNCGRCPRNYAHVFDTVEVMGIRDNHAISIEK